MTDLINILLPPGRIRLKVGLFFGSFNPPHIGHLAIANYMTEFTGIDQLWFVVSPKNPLKDQDILLNEYDRLEMVRLAVGEDPRFRVSDVEFRLPKPSYTIDTLNQLKGKFPDHTFSVIMGSDNLENFRHWKSWEAIAENYPVWVYPRPGFVSDAVLPHPNMQLIKAPLMEISSTFIRNAIREGKNLRFFVPHQVWSYIEKMNFYRK